MKPEKCHALFNAQLFSFLVCPTSHQSLITSNNKTMAKVKLTQVRSIIHRTQRQKDTMYALGLRKILWLKNGLKNGQKQGQNLEFE